MPRVYVPRGYRPQRNVRTTLKAGPFIGCNEAEAYASSTQDNQPYNTDPSLAYRIVNGMPHNDRSGGVVQRRPYIGVTAPSASAEVQYIGDFPMEDGTWLTVAIAGGEIYKAVGFSGYAITSWTKLVSTANLTTAGATISATHRIRCVAGNDLLVISDGTNTPIQWDGSSGAGGVTVLSNCPVLYGQPTIHAGKLFGIKNAARFTFVWSEENDFTTGYEAGGYNNAWDFQQTSASPLSILIGSNAGLHVIRERGYSFVSGTVNADFVSAATTDAISATIGSMSPDGAAIYRDRIVFVGSDLWPHLSDLNGGGLLAFPGERTAYISGLDKSNLASWEMLVDVDNSLAYCTRDLVAADTYNKIALLDLRADQYFGFHRFLPNKDIVRCGTVRDENGLGGTNLGWYNAIATADFELYLQLHGFSGAVGGLVADLVTGDTFPDDSTRVPLTLVTQVLGREIPGVLTADQATFHGVFPNQVVVDFVTQSGAGVLTNSAAGYSGYTYPMSNTGGEFTSGFGPVVANEFHVRMRGAANIAPTYLQSHEFDAIEVPVTAQPRDPRRA